MGRMKDNVSEEKEEEAAIRIRANRKNERQCIKGRRRRRNDC